MKPWAGILMLVGLMLSPALLLAPKAHAQQALGLGLWSGSVELGYERDRQQTRTEGDAQDFSLLRHRFDERLDLRNQGFFVLDPRLVSGNLGLTLDLFQERDRFDNTERSLDGKLVGYAFDTGFLSEKPYSATLFANRNQDVVTRDFGGRSEITYENRGAAFRLREDSLLKDLGIPYFSSTVGIRQEHTQESTTVLGQSFQRDDARNIFNYEGHKGFETADLDLRYELADIDNREVPAAGFQTRAASLAYSQDFGPTLNRRWDSRLHSFTRTDGSQFSLFTADEQLRIDHYQNLFTDYRYLFSRVDTPTGDTDTQTGTFQVQHRLYRNLTTNVRTEAMRQTLPGGERAYDAARLNLNYQRTLPERGYVFTYLGSEYRVDDNNLAVSQIDVIDEPHTAPTPLGGGAGFTLNNRFVILSTIVVVDTRGSLRATAVLGVDYELVQEGDFTKVVPLLTSFVILAGDPLAVSYTFTVAPSIKFSTTSWWLNTGVDLRWLAVSFAHEQHDQTLRAGQDNQFLEDRISDTAQLTLRGDWGRVQAQAGATRQWYDSTRLQYIQRRFSQLLSYRFSVPVTLSTSAEQSATDYSLPERENKSASTWLTLNWAMADGWFVTGFANRREFKDSLAPDEEIRETGITAQRTFGKLDVVSTLSTSDRERGATETTDRRFIVKVRRRF